MVVIFVIIIAPKLLGFSRYGEERMAKDVETLTTLSDQLEKKCQAEAHFRNETLTCQLGTMNEDQILNKVKELQDLKWAKGNVSKPFPNLFVVFTVLFSFHLYPNKYA